MAIADTESAVADDELFASLAMFMKVSALVGDRGFNFEYANGVLKVSVFPASKVNSPPDKGSWRRSGAAPATTKAPYKPRAAKHEAAFFSSDFFSNITAYRSAREVDVARGVSAL